VRYSRLPPAQLQYVRFEMSDCPQTPGAFQACAIGEVAFRAGPMQVVPEPVGLLLLATGLVGVAVVRRRPRDAA
jgi:hypothetical protein